MIKLRRASILLTTLLLILAGCGGDVMAPDPIVENPNAEAFLDQVQKECGHLDLGSQPIGFLLSSSSDDTYFVDETTKLFAGRVSREAYSDDINSFYPAGKNEKALDCIFGQLR
jgi:hypothetical protein